MSISNAVYLVVRAKGGWAVNNGADTVSFHRDHAAAAERARQMSHEAADDGDAACVVDIDVGGIEMSPNKPL